MAKHWVGTWTATPAPADGVALSSPTIRMFPRVSIGGDRVRVRLSNAAGTADLIVAATRVAHRGPGASIRPGTNRDVLFGGSKSVKIPAGAFVISDPVALDVPPLSDLAVSIHIPQRSAGKLRRYRPLFAAIELFVAAR